jgi:peptide/nickel transport system substrate-binding protein
MLQGKIHQAFLLLLVLAVASIVFFFSCSRNAAKSGAGSGAQGSGATEIRYGFSTEPVTLDPLSPSNTADGRSILFNVFEGLVKPDTEGRFLPCLAESVTLNEGGRVYLFKLRENVRFHDGSPLTVADVLFSLQAAGEAGFHGFSEIDEVALNGDNIIRITLKNPDPEFLPYLTVGIVKANSANRDKNAVGTGPYYIESYTVQQSLVLKKFADYRHGTLPKLDTVTVVFFADSDSLSLGLYGSNVDGAGLASGALIQQLTPDRFDIVPGYSAMVQLLALNNATTPLNDIRIRQAINYAIDIQDIIDTAFFGKGEPSGSPLIPGLSVYYEQSLANPYPLNHQKALALLAEAGYGNGKNLSLEITVPSVYTMHVDTAQVIASQLAKVGINANIKLVDWSTWLSDVYFGRKYQSTIISLDSPIVSPKGFLARYHSGDNSNFINFASADFDRVYNAILGETNEASRIALYKEAQKIISDNAASVYIQDILGFKAFRANAYGGVLNYPLSAIDFAAMYAK